MTTVRITPVSRSIFLAAVPMSDDDRDRAAEDDYQKCRQVPPSARRACWESAAERDAARATGKPLPPLHLGRTAAIVGGGIILYWIISEGLRVLFPPRNLVPVP